MGDIIKFKLKEPDGFFTRHHELFTVKMWISTDDQYEIDMQMSDDDTPFEVFTAIQALYYKFGIEYEFLTDDLDDIYPDEVNLEET